MFDANRIIEVEIDLPVDSDGNLTDAGHEIGAQLQDAIYALRTNCGWREITKVSMPKRIKEN